MSTPRWSICFESMVVDGCADGCRRLSMAVPMVVDGCRRSSLAVDGCRRLSMVVDGALEGTHWEKLLICPATSRPSSPKNKPLFYYTDGGLTKYHLNCCELGPGCPVQHISGKMSTVVNGCVDCCRRSKYRQQTIDNRRQPSTTVDNPGLRYAVMFGIEFGGPINEGYV